MSYPWIVVSIGDNWRAESAITGAAGPERPSVAGATNDARYLAEGGELDALFGMDAETFAALEEDASEVLNEHRPRYDLDFESADSVSGGAIFL